MLVLIVFIFGFSTSFFLIGQNQYWEYINDTKNVQQAELVRQFEDMRTIDKMNLNDDDNGFRFNMPESGIPSYNTFWGAF